MILLVPRQFVLTIQEAMEQLLDQILAGIELRFTTYQNASDIMALTRSGRVGS